LIEKTCENSLKQQNIIGAGGRSCSIKIKDKKIKGSESEIFARLEDKEKKYSKFNFFFIYFLSLFYRKNFFDFNEIAKNYDFSSMSEILKNPLAKRTFVKKMSSSTSIFVKKKIFVLK